MNRTTKMLLIAGGVLAAYYLYTKYKSQTLAVTGVTTAGQNAVPALPGTSAAMVSAGTQVATGLTNLFSQL